MSEVPGYTTRQADPPHAEKLRALSVAGPLTVIPLSLCPLSCQVKTPIVQNTIKKYNIYCVQRHSFCEYYL